MTLIFFLRRESFGYRVCLFRLFGYFLLFLHFFSRRFFILPSGFGDSPRGYLPHLSCSFLNLDVQVLLAWVDQLEPAIRQMRLHFFRVKLNSITVLLRRHTLVDALLLLGFPFSPDFSFFAPA